MNNGNYIGRRADAPGGEGSAAPAVQEDDHAAEAALGFPLHTDGPDRLGWLMNLNAVSAWVWGIGGAGSTGREAVLRCLRWRRPRAAACSRFQRCVARCMFPTLL